MSVFLQENESVVPQHILSDSYRLHEHTKANHFSYCTTQIPCLHATGVERNSHRVLLSGHGELEDSLKDPPIRLFAEDAATSLFAGGLILSAFGTGIGRIQRR